MIELIKPEWPAPPNIQALTTTRSGGHSRGPFANLNMALHVGDEPATVLANREAVQRNSCHPPVQWLNQIHSSKVVEYSDPNLVLDADAIVTERKQAACAVLTADCLPVLLTNQAGTWVAAAHAGWRGLAEGILTRTVAQYSGDSQLMAWIGPAISQQHFEVGDEVQAAFLEAAADNQPFFERNAQGRWQADLPALAQRELQSLGVKVFLSGLCTYAAPKSFYSYRRDGETGRMASMIWIE